MMFRARSVAVIGLALGIGAAANSAANAAIVFNDSFTYPNGALVGQGPWLQTGTTTTNPIQVASNRVALMNTGQDAYAALTSPVAHTDGNSIYTCFNLNVSAANAAGDYFLHLSDPVATTTNFYERVHVRSSGAGYQLGLVDTSGTGSTITYGGGVLNLNQDYFVVVAWNFVGGGTNNDTFAMYVDPTNPVEALNSTYLTHTWTSATVEPANQISAVNLRQGTAANAPTLTVDNLNVSTTFAEQVPEPASFAVAVLGGLALAARRRKA